MFQKLLINVQENKSMSCEKNHLQVPTSIFCHGERLEWWVHKDLHEPIPVCLMLSICFSLEIFAVVASQHCRLCKLWYLSSIWVILPPFVFAAWFELIYYSNAHISCVTKPPSLHLLFSNICQLMASALHELRTCDSPLFVCSLSGPFVDDRFYRFLLWLRSPSASPVVALCLANFWWDWDIVDIWYLQLRIWHCLFFQLSILSYFPTWQCGWNFRQLNEPCFVPCDMIWAPGIEKLNAFSFNFAFLCVRHQ